MHKNPFTDAEIDKRLGGFRAVLAERELDAGILSSPENIFYLTGLDHWGYFAPHMLIVPTEDRRPVLITRAMERIAIENMVRSADFRGHSDSETAADAAIAVLNERGLCGRRLGLEAWSWGLSHGLATKLKANADARWTDISGVVDLLRQVKSSEEQQLLRAAARVTDAATAAAVHAVRDGANEAEVAAACLAAMTLAGGEPPGFGPFIRPKARLGEEHATWGHGALDQGEAVFLEVAGCVSRYHAPNGRLIHVGPVPTRDREVAAIVQDAFDATLEALRPGALGRDVYAAWQGVVDAAGLSHYRRHHCGYAVGIAFPPTWTGGPGVTGLRHDSELEIREGMSFHVISWLMGCGRGDFYFTDSVLLTGAGPEVLTKTTRIGEA
jgi:Xaa-Pro dipeptidase